MKKLADNSYGRCMYFVTNVLARKMEKLATENWKKVDLFPSHGYLLLLVLEQPGIQPMALSQELHLEPSTITRLLEKLEQKKLIVRTTEGKLTNVYPTPKAKELLPKMKQCVADFSEGTASVISKPEIQNLIKSAGLIVDKLTN